MKTSSKAREWWKRWNERPGEKMTAKDYEFMKELELDDLPSLVQILDKEARPHQRDLLIELANLQDGKESLDRFARRFPSVKKLRANHKRISLIRDALRCLWRDPKMTGAAVQAVAWGIPSPSVTESFKESLRRPPKTWEVTELLNEWFLDEPKSRKSGTGWTQISPLGITRPMADNFLGQLAWAIAQNYSRFHVCKNPDCATPFYLWRRFDQQYCSSDGCVRYANRIAANRYWGAKGKQRRSLGKVV